MTLTAARPRPLEARLTTLPDTYRLLAVFSGIPTPPLEALERAGMKDPGQPVTPAARGTLRQLRDQGLIRWVRWAAPDGERAVLTGYVLTGMGEAALDTYHDRYGPALTRRGAG